MGSDNWRVTLVRLLLVLVVVLSGIASGLAVPAVAHADEASTNVMDYLEFYDGRRWDFVSTFELGQFTAFDDYEHAGILLSHSNVVEPVGAQPIARSHSVLITEENPDCGTNLTDPPKWAMHFWKDDMNSYWGANDLVYAYGDATHDIWAGIVAAETGGMRVGTAMVSDFVDMDWSNDSFDAYNGTYMRGFYAWNLMYMPTVAELFTQNTKDISIADAQTKLNFIQGINPIAGKKELYAFWPQTIPYTTTWTPIHAGYDTGVIGKFGYTTTVSNYDLDFIQGAGYDKAQSWALDYRFVDTWESANTPFVLGNGEEVHGHTVVFRYREGRDLESSDWEASYDPNSATENDLWHINEQWGFMEDVGMIFNVTVRSMSGNSAWAHRWPYLHTELVLWDHPRDLHTESFTITEDNVLMNGNRTASSSDVKVGSDVAGGGFFSVYLQDSA